MHPRADDGGLGPVRAQERSDTSGRERNYGSGAAVADPGEGDDGGKPTIDEPTGPALDPTPDEFDKEAEGE